MIRPNTTEIAEELEAAIKYIEPQISQMDADLKTTKKNLRKSAQSADKKGMIYSPSHGNMAFTAPLFDEFMQRAMPEFEAND